MSHDLETPVLIVGGGGAGLTASMLLSQIGIESLLVSALPTTSILPKAHVLNQRAMEIMTDVGTAEEIYRRGTPREQMSATAFYAGFAGPSRDHGRLMKKMDCWGAGYTNVDWVGTSPCAQSNLPQIRLEPILKRRAEELAPGKIRFHHEVKSVEQDDEGVTALVHDKDNDQEYRIRSRWLLACDGGRTIGRSLGVTLDGESSLANEISVHFGGDLSPWAKDPDVLIRWIWIPERASLAVLVPMGPDHWGPDSEEWVFHINFLGEDSKSVSDDEVVEMMRQILGIGDHPLTVHKVSHWSLVGLVASSFQVDRVFMAGDAAHRHPPTGGLGLTSAMHDVQNLCWKIAMVEQGHAGAELLATYEPERKPSDTRNVQRSVDNALNHLAIGQVMGMDPESTAEENWSRLRRWWSDNSADSDYKRALRKALASQSMEFTEHVVEYGYHYESSAVVPDGTEAPATPDDVRLHQPTTRPGHPLPHAWLEDDDDRRFSTIDLVKPGRFVLIAGEEGAAWCEAARALANRHSLPLDAWRIGHLDGDLLDFSCRWLRQREIGPKGAILVRPDRFVAWRSLGESDDSAGQLRAALEQVLARPLAAAGGAG